MISGAAGHKTHHNRSFEPVFDPLKSTQAPDFHSLFLNFFSIIQSTKDTKHSTPSIFKNLLRIRLDI
jgi:hypothetical protein